MVYVSTATTQHPGECALLFLCDMSGDGQVVSLYNFDVLLCTYMVHFIIVSSIVFRMCYVHGDEDLNK